MLITSNVTKIDVFTTRHDKIGFLNVFNVEKEGNKRETSSSFAP